MKTALPKKRLIYFLLIVAAIATTFYIGNSWLANDILSRGQTAQNPITVFGQYFKTASQPTILYSKITGLQDHNTLFVFRDDGKTVLDTTALEVEQTPEDDFTQFKQYFEGSEYYSLLTSAEDFHFTYYQRKNAEGHVTGHYTLAMHNKDNIYFFHFKDY